MGEEAYGVGIKREIEERLERKVSIGALHTALQRMTDKGLVSSQLGEATAERGGKRKRYFEVTADGEAVLERAREDRMKMWKSIPKFS